MRVLVVEDDVAVRNIAVAALRQAGFEVTEPSQRQADSQPVDIRLPDLFAGATDSGADPTPTMSSGHLTLETPDPLRVLVVENNEALREPIAEGLRQAGFGVVEAANGKEALSHIGQRFDVLFTDIDLPGGMDGWAIAQRWRENDPTIGVIYTSGFCLDHGRYVQGGRCVPKPYRPGQIVAAVVEVANMCASLPEVPTSSSHGLVSRQ